MVSGVKRPTKDTYDKFLSFFLSDIPDVNCAKAGKAAYSNVFGKNQLNLFFHSSIEEFQFILFYLSGCQHYRGGVKSVFHELSHKSDDLL